VRTICDAMQQCSTSVVGVPVRGPRSVAQDIVLSKGHKQVIFILSVTRPNAPVSRLPGNQSASGTSFSLFSVVEMPRELREPVQKKSLLLHFALRVGDLESQWSSRATKREKER